jgi:hypothetical protein
MAILLETVIHECIRARLGRRANNNYGKKPEEYGNESPFT